MHIEIGVPAVLPLAFSTLSTGTGKKSVMLGIALQHPPTHLLASRSKNLSIYGPQAHIVRSFAAKKIAKAGSSDPIEIRIESTTPSLVGLGSKSGLALSAAQAVAWVNNESIDPDNSDDSFRLWEQLQLGYEDPLALHGLANGGVVLVE